MDRIDDPLDLLLAECLDRMERDGPAGLDALLAEHPEHAAELRERLSALRHIGLLEVGAPHAFPERLGDFRLIEPLGGGGMGVVYLAHQESLGREVALKLIRPGELYFPDARARFQREVEAVARLQHPGIVPIYAVGEQDSVPFFAMERVRGCTLADVLEVLAERDPARLSGADLDAAIGAATGESAPPDEPSPLFRGTWEQTCLRIVREVAEALEHAHRLGVVHRDLKPSNVMVTRGGRVMLLDFGLSSAEGVDRMTRTGAQLGSLPYLAPERIAGGERTDPRLADVYGLGVTLYELLTTELPFRGPSLTSLQRAILDARPAPLCSRNRAASWETETLCATAMDRDPARRYASAADLARDVTNVLERRPIVARRAGFALRARRWVQRRPAAAVAAVLAPLALVGIPTAIAVQEWRSSRALAAEGELTWVSLEKSLEAIDEMLVVLANEHLAEVPYFSRLRRRLLLKAQDLYESLAAEEFARHGDGRLGAGLRMRQRNARAGLGKVFKLLGEQRLAREALRAVVALDDELAETTDDPVFRMRRIAARKNLAEAEERLGDPHEALRLCDTALELVREAGPGSALQPSGQPLLARVHAARATTLARMGEDAGEAYGDAEEATREHLDLDPENPELRYGLARILNARAGGLRIQGHVFEARDDLQAALALLDEGLDDVDDPLGVRVLIAQIHANLGGTAMVIPLLDTAEEHFRAALSIQTELARSFPGAGHYELGRLEAVVSLLGVVAQQVDGAEEAASLMAEGRALAEDLVERHPDLPKSWSTLGFLEHNQAVAAHAQGRYDVAADGYWRAAECQRRALLLSPGSAEFGSYVRNHLISLAKVNVVLEDPDPATAALGEGMETGDPDLVFCRRAAGAYADCSRLVGADPAREEEAVALRKKGLAALELAAAKGYADLNDLRGSPTLAPLRTLPGFAKLERRVAAVAASD